ncbi:GTP cyclohydrolase I [Candidatus Electrothrix marina]|uniref:GTP cyclohydrolase I n=1 Tax=Candidatus Electrothrix marina TaxID=1859130 RepID=A0A444JAT6_9BACT|nr:GTP cyclohydrolase I [Candidatus Electrothrix marina]
MKDQLDAEAAHLEVRFPYFLERAAEEGSGMDRYECRLHGSLQECDDLVMELNVPITLPESMGRWGYAQVSVRFNEFIWLEDLIGMVQQAIRAGSERTASVESLCGQLGDALKATSEVSWFRVEVENLAGGCSTFATVESTLS